MAERKDRRTRNNSSAGGVSRLLSLLQSGADYQTIVSNVENAERWGVEGKERGNASEANAHQALAQLEDVQSAVRTKQFSGEDMSGIDIIIRLGSRYDSRRVFAQVKSSVAGILKEKQEQAIKMGVALSDVDRVFIKRNLVFLNGSLPAEEIQQQFLTWLEEWAAVRLPYEDSPEFRQARIDGMMEEGNYVTALNMMLRDRSLKMPETTLMQVSTDPCIYHATTRAVFPNGNTITAWEFSPGVASKAKHLASKELIHRLQQNQFDQEVLTS